MAQLRQHYEAFQKLDAEVVVVGPDNDEQFEGFWEEHQLPFIGLPDPKHTVLKRYGQEVKLFKLGRLPAQCLIDKQGLVRYVHYGKSMADIPDGEEMLALLQQLNIEGTKTQTT